MSIKSSDTDSNEYKTGSTSGLFNATDTHETIQALELAISQIDMALKEADTSVTELIGAMTCMTGSVMAIENKLTDLSDNTQQQNTINQIRASCNQVDASMQKAVIAFQFYDRLSQRFQHIHENLNAVAHVIRAPGSDHPALWQALRAKISSVYSFEQEHDLLKSFNHETPPKDTGSFGASTRRASEDIELF